jgi:hypothetical protein
MSPLPMSAKRARVGYATAAAGPIAILYWRSEFSVAAVEAIAATLVSIKRHHRGRRLGFLTVIEPTLEVRVPPDVQKAVAAFLAEVDSELTAAAVVYEAHGFRATITRSVVTAINLAARASFANRVFSDLDEGLSWMTAKIAPHDLHLREKLNDAITRLQRPAADDGWADR